MQVWHMDGAGNDFAVMDARGIEVDFEIVSKEFCRIFDADGFMAVTDSALADFKLHFYNADGSRGEMCGNGARCICRFAFEKGIANEKMTVETDAGIVYGERLSEDRYRVQLNLPGMIDPDRKEDTAYVELGDPGVPHGIKRISDLTWDRKEELRSLAKNLRYDPAFLKGANINFYDWIGEDEIRILTYERGVEDYTLACGTGSAATAIVLWLEGRLPYHQLKVWNPGGLLLVSLTVEDGKLSAVYLEGPTRVTEKSDMSDFLCK